MSDSCDPMDCSLLGSSVHGISQARILEWVAISFSRGSSLPIDGICLSCIGRWVLYHHPTKEVQVRSSDSEVEMWLHCVVVSLSCRNKIQ